MKKYVCIGGYVDSVDGDRHYIGPYRLSELYQVNPDECYFAQSDDDYLLRALRIEKLIVLKPRYNGDYINPTQAD